MRSLENNLKKLLRQTARKFVEEEIDQVKISKDDLPDMLGRKAFAEESRYKTPKIGVITGLAYTPASVVLLCSLRPQMLKPKILDLNKPDN